MKKRSPPTVSSSPPALRTPCIKVLHRIVIHDGGREGVFSSPFLPLWFLNLSQTLYVEGCSYHAGWMWTWMWGSPSLVFLGGGVPDKVRMGRVRASVLSVIKIGIQLEQTVAPCFPSSLLFFFSPNSFRLFSPSVPFQIPMSLLWGSRAATALRPLTVRTALRWATAL